MKITQHDVQRTIRSDMAKTVEILQDLLANSCPGTCLDCIYRFYCIHDDSKMEKRKVEGK